MAEGDIVGTVVITAAAIARDDWPEILELEIGSLHADLRMQIQATKEIQEMTDVPDV